VRDHLIRAGELLDVAKQTREDDVERRGDQVGHRDRRD